MKERINIGNYESYLLDYLEGSLPEEREEELLHFLELHPELKGALEEYEEVRLFPPAEGYEGKKALRRADYSFESIDELNVEEAMIAYREGDLSLPQRQRLEEYLIQNPVLERDFLLYGKVFLKPPAVSYTKKGDLYKRERRIAAWIPAAAAAVALLLALSFFLRQQENPAPAVVAGVEKSDVPEPPGNSLQKEIPKPEGENVRQKENIMAQTLQRPLSHGKKEKVQSQGSPSKEVAVKDDPSSREAPRREIMRRSLPVRVFPLPVAAEKPALVIPEKILTASPVEDIDLLAEKTGQRIKKNLLKKELTKKRTPREVFFNGLAKVNTATGLNLNYERVEDPDRGREYVAVTTSFFSYIRRKKEDK